MDKILKAAKILKNGGTVIYPGDTYYALGANIYDDHALEKVAKAKGLKPGEKPFPVVVENFAQVADIAHLDADHRDIMQKLWPGPILFLLPKKTSVSSYLSGPSNLIGVIKFQNDVPQELVQRLGFPITATSANPTGGKDVVRPNQIIIDHDLLLKSVCPYGERELTILDLFNNRIVQFGIWGNLVEKFLF
jgi:L-threonylcarbamoyladenylate synthase